MAFLVRKCVRCGVVSQLDAIGMRWVDRLNAEIFFACNACGKGSIYQGQPSAELDYMSGEIENDGRHYDELPIIALPETPELSDDIPERVRELFQQAALSRLLGLYDASGAMFRKAIDVSTKILYATDARLAGKVPAQAPRARVEALKNLKIIEDDIWELADVALMDGNGAAHDEDPYSAEEAEALEDLTNDLLERLFVRPARIARVKGKQLAAGMRKT